MNPTEFFLESDRVPANARTVSIMRNVKIAALLLVTAVTLYLKQTGTGSTKATAISSTISVAPAVHKAPDYIHAR